MKKIMKNDGNHDNLLENIMITYIVDTNIFTIIHNNPHYLRFLITVICDVKMTFRRS